MREETRLDWIKLMLLVQADFNLGGLVGKSICAVMRQVV